MSVLNRLIYQEKTLLISDNARNDGVVLNFILDFSGDEVYQSKFLQ